MVTQVLVQNPAVASVVAPAPVSIPTFTVRRAVTPEDMKMVYKLRYQVFCRERGMFPREDYQAEQEMDEFDAISHHFLAVDSFGTPIGTVRLVPATAAGLPMEQYCTFTEDVTQIHGQRAEISRLSISKVFRKEAGGVLNDVKGSVQSEGLTDQCIVLMSLLRAMYQASKELGIEHWQATMERSLFVMLKRQGMMFRPIGPEVNHVGVRAPYFAQIADLERMVSSKRPRVAAQFGYAGMVVQGTA